MRLPGEPAKPPALAHSFVMLGAVLAETEALDRASSMGDGVSLTLSGTDEALMSGVLMGGVDSLEVGRLLLERLLLLLLLLHQPPQRSASLSMGTILVTRGATHENRPAVCLVTAAAMPLCSLAFFLSFSAILGQLRCRQSCAARVGYAALAPRAGTEASVTMAGHRCTGWRGTQRTRHSSGIAKRGGWSSFLPQRSFVLPQNGQLRHGADGSG